MSYYSARPAVESFPVGSGSAFSRFQASRARWRLLARLDNSSDANTNYKQSASSASSARAPLAPIYLGSQTGRLGREADQSGRPEEGQRAQTGELASERRRPGDDFGGPGSQATDSPSSTGTWRLGSPPDGSPITGRQRRVGAKGQPTKWPLFWLLLSPAECH